MRKLELSACCLGMVLALGAGSTLAQTLPGTPRIDSLVSLRPSPLETDADVIWYDDFDGSQKLYTESQGRVDTSHGFGGSGGSMLSFYKKGTRGIGNRKVFFGDSPTGRVVNKGRQYDEIYWRVYVKHQHGWTGGGPAKLSRATSIVSPRWAQGMIAHVWSSGEALTLDPATGVRGDRVVTTKYNDFDNLRWLGNRPASSFKLHSTEESGRWVCVEARVKLNTPGKKDGLNQLWIDGRLEAERKGLDWRGSYNNHGINAVFLETYWNKGSPVTQSRWLDNFVISTKPIGPVVCSGNPVLIKTPYCGPGAQRGWQVEIAADERGESVVWKSGLVKTVNKAQVGPEAGRFVGPFSARVQLDAGGVYFVRVRQQSTNGTWSAWSPWHQPFKI